jgi:hypothetical protein
MVHIDSTCYENYHISNAHHPGIDRCIPDDGKNAMWISFSSGLVRCRFTVAKNHFVMGSGFNTAAPAELTQTFVKDKQGEVVLTISNY